MASALPTQLQEYVHLSRYARWRNEDNRRETWAETVQRYTDFFASKFPDTYPTELINHAIASLHVMPSMRALMTAGPALERDNMAGFNPVDGATRVVTREFGNVPISTLSGASATVLNKEGRWATATFRSYGIQPTKKVAFKRNSNTLREVVCTANHRWVLDNGTVKATEELKNGDHVAFVSAPRPAIDADYTLGVRHGVVYGDGTMTKAHRRVRGYHLRLCSDSKELLPWFDGYPVAYPPSMCGDPIVMMYDSFAATHSLKALPDDGETESYLLGFLRGWLAADGTVGKRGEPTLCCDARGVEWLRRNTERLGISITRVYQQSYITNFGVRTQPSFIVGFSRSSMLPEDQLCSWKAARIVPIKSRFVVVDVEDMPEPTEVFCAEVPDTNTFVLEGGLVTGNCAAVAVDHVRAFDEILYILMCFHPDTLVVTRNGSKRIADIVAGDEVSSIDEATGLAVWKRVTNQIKTKSALRPKVEVTLDNGHAVKCTADHKWLTTNRGWVEAGDLKVSDDLTAPSSMKITHVRHIEDAQDYYDITVEDTHNFLLADGSIVHNCGTGMGFSVERQSISKLPDVPDELHHSDTMITVADSKVGWATAFKELLSLLYAGQIPVWDTSKIRPAGAKLKVFGGRASGPKPLEDLFLFTIGLFRRAVGRKLTSVECHDLVCKIADIVVVGGVRRSALISLSNLSDDRMRVAKSGQWWEQNPQRALANNSVAYTEKPDMELFLKEWLALIESKSGERGLFNRAAVKKKAAEYGRRDSSHDFLTNPCLTARMRILTDHGNEAIGTLVGKSTKVWNGFTYSDVVPFSTGVNPIFSVRLSNGVSMEVTPYHKFILADGSRVEARNLATGAKLAKHVLPAPNVKHMGHATGYSQGFYAGDGCADNTASYIYEPKYACAAGLNGRVLPDGAGVRKRMRWVHGHMENKNYVPHEQDIHYRAAWVSGLFDADACIISNPNSVGLQLTSVDEAFLLETRLLLTTLGAQSKVTQNQRGERTFDGYPCQDVYRLCVGAVGVAALMAAGVRFRRLAADILSQEPNRDAGRFVTVLDVSDLGRMEETFCLTEPKRNSMVVEGVMVGNCAEIALRSAGLCNLTEVVIRADDTLADIRNKVVIATIMGTYQSTLTNYRYVRSIWKKNADEERLLGVSMTGIMDHPILSEVTKVAESWLKDLRLLAVETNALWAEKLGIPPSVAITTVKPSGTVSQLVDSASGIHPRYSGHYIRTVRGDKKDPLAQFMRAEGFPVEDCVMKPDTVDIFSFPVQAPSHAVLRNDRSALDQLDHYLMFKRHWCEHNVSITVYVREHEWLAVGDWVYTHFDELCGVSFLPHSEHTYRQAPYTECTVEEYDALVRRMPTVQWDALQAFEKDDSTVNTKELACSAGMCEIL